MTPKILKEYSDLRRQQILEAAWGCFIEKGYSETSVREIAKRMKASTGVIYHYFKGKEEILEALQKWSIENNRKIFAQMNQRNTAREAIMEFFENNFQCCPIDELKENQQGNISLWSEALKRKNIRKMLNSFYEFMEGNISRFIKEGMKNGEIRADLDPNVTAGFFIALIIGMQLQIAVIDGLDTSKYIEGMKEILSANIWKED